MSIVGNGGRITGNGTVSYTTSKSGGGGGGGAFFQP